MDTTPFQTNGRKAITVSPEEGRQLLAQQLLATLREQGDIASEHTWQAHAVLLLRHSEKFLEELGILQLLKMQELCASMVLKIRLANRKAPDENTDVLAEYESLMNEVFAAERADEFPEVLPVPEEEP